MAPKAPVVYSVAELEELSRADLIKFKQNIETALSNSEQTAMDNLRDQLKASGIDIKQFVKHIGINLDPPAPAAQTTNVAKGNKGKAPSPTTEIRKRYHGRTVLAGRDNKGTADYEIDASGKGAAPGWVIELFTNGQLEEHLSEPEEAPSVVTPPKEGEAA